MIILRSGSGKPDSTPRKVRFSGLLVSVLLLTGSSATAQDWSEADGGQSRVVKPWPSVDTPPRSGTHVVDDAALVVGVENYMTLPTTPYARRDADAVATWLLTTRGLPASHVVRVLDPSQAELDRALAQAASRLGPTGTLWVYLSGQGVLREGSGMHFLAADAQIETGGLALSSLDALAQGLAGRRVIAIVDATMSGRTRTGPPLAPWGRSTQLLLPLDAADPVPRSSGLILWMASRHTEIAGAFTGDGKPNHGLFTYHVLGALFGWADGATGAKDGRVTLGEAQTWVRSRIAALGREQTPSVEERPGFDALVLTKALRAEPSWEDLDPGKPPKGEASTSSQIAMVLPDNARVRRGLAALGDEVEVKEVEGFENKVVATLPREQAHLLLPRSAQDDLAPQDPSAQAKERAWAVEEIRRQFQGKADAAWAGVLRRLRTGDADAVLHLANFVSRWSEVIYPWAGTDVAVSAVQIPRAEALLALAHAGGVSVPTVPIEAATFRLGTPAGTLGRGPDETEHEVRLTRGFVIATHELDRALWAVLAGDAPLEGPDARPATGMSWLDAVQACNVASTLSGLAVAYTIDGTTVTAIPDANGWRLPTEAEWALAAGAGAYVGHTARAGLCTTANLADPGTPEASRDPAGRGSCEDGFGDLAPVGSLRPTGAGLYDLAGNAAEWVFDAWAPWTSERAVDPRPDRPDRVRVVKGGSWRSGVSAARPSARAAVPFDQGRDDVGLRLVRADGR